MAKTKKAPAKNPSTKLRGDAKRPTPKKKGDPKSPSSQQSTSSGKTVVLKPVDPRFQMTVEGITMTIFSRKAGNPMTVERMKELLGWKIVDKDSEDYLLTFGGERIKCERNPTNRPFRPAFAKRYMNEMLRGKWRLNGETMIIDENDDAQSMQHRGIALIWAEHERKKDVKQWSHIWGDKPITIDCIVVQGISSDPDVLDTIDLGQKRSLGDVLYRDSAFSDDNLSNKARQKITNALSAAVRLVWIRSGGKTVSSAPHFPHSEALDFLNQNPKIADSVRKLFELENGNGQNGQKISRFLSLAYASALHYLMSVSGTDQDTWANDPTALDFSMEEKANEFWEKVASGANLKENDPVHVLREMMPRISGSTGFGRDELVTMVVKAFNLFADGKKAKPNDIKVRTKKDDMDRTKIAEWPRLGGIDVEDPTIPLGDEATPEIQELDTNLVGVKEGDDWGVGDRAWVKPHEGVDAWYGTIDEIVGDTVTLTDHLTGQAWDENVKYLVLEFPG